MALFQQSQDPSPPTKEVETLIGPSVKVDGNFRGQGDVVVEGIVQGSLKTEKNLRVGAGAKIVAQVSAANAVIAGEVRGNMKIKEKLELLNTARIFGDIEVKTLAIEPGAILHGKCTMAKEEMPTESSKPQTSPPQPKKKLEQK